MANYGSILGVAVATSLLLSACMGRQGVVDQSGVAGEQNIARSGGLVGGQQASGNRTRGIFGQQMRTKKDQDSAAKLEEKQPEKVMTAKERFAGTAAAHNVVRTKKSLAGLIWSDTLASYAQEWADHLAKVNNCQLNHRPTSGPMKQKYGENLWWGDADVWSDGSRKLQNATIESVVKTWAGEVAHYNYDENSCLPGKECSNYTQIMWQDTTSVGCGFQQCSDKSQVWVCNYNPPGNFIGDKPY